MVFDGNVTVAGIVDGNVTVAGGNGVISGTVNGSITALDANLHLRKRRYRQRQHSGGRRIGHSEIPAPRLADLLTRVSIPARFASLVCKAIGRLL